MQTAEVTTTKPSVCLEVLSAFRGHKNVTVDDSTDVEGRKELAKHVEAMLKDGYSVFLVDDNDRMVSRRIKSYDWETHEWVVYSTARASVHPQGQPVIEPAPVAMPPARRRGRPKKGEVRIPAEGTKAAAVAGTVGG